MRLPPAIVLFTVCFWQNRYTLLNPVSNYINQTLIPDPGQHAFYIKKGKI
jgi:hypothetical protein